MTMKNALRVLLVDDDDTFWKVVQAVVKRDADLAKALQLARLSNGYELVQCINGLAPEPIPGFGRWPDIILLDQRMPILDGTEALEQLREKESDGQALVVCMLSSSAQEDLVRQAYETGANFYLEKPGTLEELRAMLHRLVSFFTEVTELPTPPPHQRGPRQV